MKWQKSNDWQKNGSGRNGLPSKRMIRSVGTNYTLTQEEQRGDATRQYEKLSERVTHLEDAIQEIQDTLHQINDLTGKRLQSMLTVVHEWVSNYERSSGSSR